MISKVCFACFFFCSVLNWESSYVLGARGKANQEKELELLSKILDQSLYDKRVRPNGINGTRPTIVSVNLYVQSFDMVDENKMEYGMQLTFRQQWLDGRLAYENNKDMATFRYLNLNDVSQVWIPDLFFSNEKTVHQHQFMKPNSYLRIFPNGEVLYSTRISLVLSCPMLTKLFPTCSMRMSSYGYTTEDIIFKWKAYDPVQVTSALHIPKFALEQFTTDYCDSQTNTGTYSCLRVDFSLRRIFNINLLDLYIPTNMIVIVAWLGSWLDKKAVTARILVCLSTLFVQALENSRFSASLPTTGYTKSIDVWIGLTRTFVFACFVEFIVVHYLSTREDVEKTNCSTKEESPNREEVPLNDKLNDEVQPTKKNIRQTDGNCLSRCLCKSQKIDDIFRIVLPIIYVLFVIIYAFAP